MNSIATRKNIITNTIGALMILGALGAGATLGDFTSPNTPAEAVVPTEDNCTLICNNITPGGGGNTPNPLHKNNGGGGNLPTPR